MQVGYEWLLQEPGPKMLLESIKLYGTREITGDKNNHVIMSWADELKIPRKVYSSDEVPWCGLEMAIAAKRAGKVPPAGMTWESLLWALNWAKFGTPVTTAMLGDVITFVRGNGGHVGLYVGEDPQAYHIFGGNQTNAVNITRWKKDKKYSITRPPYINQPANVRKIILLPVGSLATNAA